MDAALTAAAKTLKIERANLKKRIEAAAGPHDRQGCRNLRTSTGPMQVTRGATNFDRMTAIIGDYVDVAIAESVKLAAKNHAVGASLSDRQDRTLSKTLCRPGCGGGRLSTRRPLVSPIVRCLGLTPSSMR